MRFIRTNLSAYDLHEPVVQFHVSDHEEDRRRDRNDRSSVPVHKTGTPYEDKNAYRQADHTGDHTGDVFPDIYRMSDVDEEMTCEGHEYAEPKAVENIAREIICQKADAEEGNEFFIDPKGKCLMGQSAIRLHYLRKTVKKIGVSFEEPEKSGDLFHVVKDEQNR